MAETNPEFGRAVSEVLDWMGASPETAGAALGINARTLVAMTQGIVPMRSLILKFAQGVAAQNGAAGAQEWWKDPDAWLIKAGMPVRREGGHPAAVPRPAPTMSPARVGEPPPPRLGGNGHAPRPAGAAVSHAFAPPGPAVAASPDPPAHEQYRPVYERQACGGTVVHVFWILDRQERRCYQIHMPAHVDYKARAAQVKADLHSLTQSQFERKYGRFRIREQVAAAAPGD